MTIPTAVEIERAIQAVDDLHIMAMDYAEAASSLHARIDGNKAAILKVLPAMPSEQLLNAEHRWNPDDSKIRCRHCGQLEVTRIHGFDVSKYVDAEDTLIQALIHVVRTHKYWIISGVGQCQCGRMFNRDPLHPAGTGYQHREHVIAVMQDVFVMHQNQPTHDDAVKLVQRELGGTVEVDTFEIAGNGAIVSVHVDLPKPVEVHAFNPWDTLPEWCRTCGRREDNEAHTQAPPANDNQYYHRQCTHCGERFGSSLHHEFNKPGYHVFDAVLEPKVKRRTVFDDTHRFSSSVSEERTLKSDICIICNARRDDAVHT